MLWGLGDRGHQVHVLSLVADNAQQEAMRALPNVASSESHVIPPDLSYLSGGSIPSAVRRSYRSWIAHRIEELVREYSADVVQLEYTQAAAYVSAAQGVPVVLTEHDVAFLYRFRTVRRERSVVPAVAGLFDAVRTYLWEIRQAKRADLVLTMSDREAALLRRRGVAHASGAVPSGVDVDSLEPRGPRCESRDILFVGNFWHSPNTDGLGYFISKIWPRLRELAPHLNVSVVGPNLPADLAAEVTRLGFRYAGYVEDLAAELWSHKVFIVPIRYGTGTRIKVLEAAGAKCAMVSTTLGVEGIEVRDRQDVLIADEPEDFAQAVVELLGDDDLRARLGASAHAVMRRRYDWPILVRNLEELYYELLKRG